jgi:hypothetical protein
VAGDEIIVTGDNESMSFDSRQAGPFEAGGVRGVVIRGISTRRPTRADERLGADSEGLRPRNP